MASPEIDEAAAVFFAEHATHSNWTSANLARAALRWKARAEELAAEEEALLARAKAAEAEVKRLEDLVSEGHSLFVDHTLCCGNEAQHKEARRVANARQLAQSEKAR